MPPTLPPLKVRVSVYEHRNQDPGDLPGVPTPFGRSSTQPGPGDPPKPHQGPGVFLATGTALSAPDGDGDEGNETEGNSSACTKAPWGVGRSERSG